MSTTVAIVSAPSCRSIGRGLEAVRNSCFSEQCIARVIVRHPCIQIM
jgi:hypothetical protein